MKSIFYFPFSLLFLGSTQFSSSADISDGMLERHILDRLLDKTRYDPKARPNGTSDGANVIKVQMYILDLPSVDDKRMEFSARMYLRQIWTDSRLIYDDIDGRISTLTVSVGDKIWKPDLFFTNEREGSFHYMTTPNVFTKVSSTGEVRYSMKITVKFTCTMNLVYFPLDIQTCSMFLESYGHNAKTLLLEWSEEENVGISDDIYIPDFSVKGIVPRDCSKNLSFGDYSCLQVDIMLARRVGFYIKSVYIPYITMIFLSWITFWLDSRHLYIRTALILMLFLMTFMLTCHITDNVPPVSYTKAIDVWTGMCLTFIFAALVEFLLVIIFRKNEEDQEKEAENVPMETGMLQDDTTGQKDGKKDAKKDTKINIKLFQRYLKKYPSKSQRCDVASRILFPILFAFFNLVYWCAYTCGQSAQPLKV